MPERNTRQKEIVRYIFEGMHTHPTAEAVYAAVKQAHPTIGRATVYRTLAALAKRGDILKIPVSDGADRYDETILPHSHIKCERCGAIGDIFRTEQESLPPTTEDLGGYILHRKTVLYYGLCPVCARSINDREKQ